MRRSAGDHTRSPGGPRRYGPVTAASHLDAGGAEMGDKGGKKDKNKNKQQQTKKHQEEAQRKQDKARPKL